MTNSMHMHVAPPPAVQDSRTGRPGPVAVVTAGDLFKFVVSEQSMALEELEEFIFDEQGGEG